MSTYNGSAHLDRSIESILSQTFDDFEFIIVDDASTDSSREIIQSYAKSDDRIILLENEKNCGLAASLNRGINLAKGNYIARMDDDDIALPDRLQTQFDYMENHPEIALVSTKVLYIDSEGNPIQEYSPPLDSVILKWKMIYSSPIRHPTVLWRKALVEPIVDGYNTSNRYAEDYEFFCKILRVSEVETLPIVLLHMRQRFDSVSFSKREQQDICAASVTNTQFDYYFSESQLTQVEKDNLRAVLRRHSPVQDNAFRELGSTELIHALNNYLKLIVSFCRVHRLDTSFNDKNLLHKEVECQIPNILKHCVAMGWPRLGIRFWLSYLRLFPDRIIPSFGMTCGYSAYYILGYFKSWLDISRFKNLTAKAES